MKIYISGPITGRPNLNKKAFEDIAIALSGKFDFFNPHEIPPPPDPLEGKALWQYYMRECVKELPGCTHIFMLRDWFESDGALEEHRIARMLGLTVLHQGSTFLNGIEM
jgi:hypothetical protein